MAFFRLKFYLSPDQLFKVKSEHCVNECSLAPTTNYYQQLLQSIHSMIKPCLRWATRDQGVSIYPLESSLLVIRLKYPKIVYCITITVLTTKHVKSLLCKILIYFCPVKFRQLRKSFHILLVPLVMEHSLHAATSQSPRSLLPYYFELLPN